jgi:hypothetical protein
MTAFSKDPSRRVARIRKCLCSPTGRHLLPIVGFAGIKGVIGFDLRVAVSEQDISQIKQSLTTALITDPSTLVSTDAVV